MNNLAYQDYRREELIDGKVIAMAPASAGHTYVADNILMIAMDAIRFDLITVAYDHHVRDKFILVRQADQQTVAERDTLLSF